MPICGVVEGGGWGFNAVVGLVEVREEGIVGVKVRGGVGVYELRGGA